jgi:hypothetical protein
MTQRITQMPKPDAEQYTGDRKLFLVPNFMIPPNAPQEGQDLLETYWSEVRTHIENLERSLGKVAHVYHEIVYADGDEGMRTLQEMNPKGSSFIEAMCHSDAKLEATEDRALLEESSDWRRCLSAGLVSEKVLTLAMDGYQQATSGRYEHIATRIDETLQAGESSVLFIGEDHRVQFPGDVKVFYVAPRSLDALKRWITGQMRAPAPPPTDESEEAGPQE